MVNFMTKVWIGFVFIIGIPLASLFLRILMALLGGFDIPLAWTFSYYSALSTALVISFVLGRVTRDWWLKLIVVIFGAFLAIGLGTAIGQASAHAGVLGGYDRNDPSRGNVTLESAITYSVMGTFSGLGLGLFNSAWLKVLLNRGINRHRALCICLGTTIVSLGIALFLSLFG
jgi:hypothetical protein